MKVWNVYWRFEDGDGCEHFDHICTAVDAEAARASLSAFTDPALVAGARTLADRVSERGLPVRVGERRSDIGPAESFSEWILLEEVDVYER